MKMNKIQECQKQLDHVFELRGLPPKTLNCLCDLMEIIDTNINKYFKIKNKILNEYYIRNNANEDWKIKDISLLEEVGKKFEEVENMEIQVEKIHIDKIPDLTPKEMIFLREFFIFE